MAASPAAPGAGAAVDPFSPEAAAAAAARFREPAAVVLDRERGRAGVIVGEGRAAGGAAGVLPPTWPEWLGDRAFTAAHGLRFPYVGGAMANGIATVRMVRELAAAGALGFFGAAGLELDAVRRAVTALREALGPDGPWGANLIHSPAEPALERAVADLYVEVGVPRVSASAYMGLTPAVVRLAAAGLREAGGRVVRRHRVFAKVSRPEVARHFVEPPPRAMLDALVAEGALTAAEARLAARVPVAEDVVVEGDSGGHTDGRPLAAIFPTIARLARAAARRHGVAIRVGAGGGLGTPEAVASAFALGAAFVIVGSVHQGCVESGLSEAARRLLAGAGVADVATCPAADMFELGAQVQVLARGTMFAARARRLHELYRAWPSLDALPAADRAWLERDLLRQPVEAAWAETRAWWEARDPAVAARADDDPHHRMALVFRAYLGRASRWAIDGVPDRVADYQVWCGPAQGAFNDWVRGSFLEPPEARTVGQVARNLLEGAAVHARAAALRAAGVPVPPIDFRPRPLA